VRGLVQGKGDNKKGGGGELGFFIKEKQKGRGGNVDRRGD